MRSRLFFLVLERDQGGRVIDSWPSLAVSPSFVLDLSAHALEELPRHDDDVYYYMAERLNRKRETENSGV